MGVQYEIINGDAHIKSLLIGHQVIVPVTDGRADFGPFKVIGE